MNLTKANLERFSIDAWIFFRRGDTVKPLFKGSNSRRDLHETVQNIAKQVVNDHIGRPQAAQVLSQCSFGILGPLGSFHVFPLQLLGHL